MSVDCDSAEMCVGETGVRCDVSVSSSDGAESLLQTPDLAPQIQVSDRHTHLELELLYI